MRLGAARPRQLGPLGQAARFQRPERSLLSAGRPGPWSHLPSPGCLTDLTRPLPHQGQVDSGTAPCPRPPQLWLETQKQLPQRASWACRP